MLFHIQEMDAKILLVHEGDEDYIDLELTSSPPRNLHSLQIKEFEFISTASAAAASPADELFYKGKLLPLHLPPPPHHHPTTTTTTIKESLYSSMSSPNISPSESCRVSCDLNSDDYFFEWSNELNTFIIINNDDENIKTTKRTWVKILGLKLKASKAYLKSFFVKSACSEVDENGQMRSFSRTIKRHSSTSSASSGSSSGSSSFSSNSNGSELHCLRRSSSATEIECSIEGAIAHCKKSQYSKDL